MRTELLLLVLSVGCGATTESSTVDASVTDATSDSTADVIRVDSGNACLAAGGSCGCASSCSPGTTHGSFAQDNACPQPCPTCGGCSMWCCVPTAVDAGAMKCPDASTFPVFSKTCSVDADCAFGLHQIDCCGSLLAVGFERTQPFEATEKAWASTCPACECAGKPTYADDGKTGASFGVRCASGACSTFVK